MKSKKIKTIVITALTGVMLLSITVAASASGGSGYDTYKNAVKDVISTRNATFSTTFEIKDNGNLDISGTNIEKLADTNMSSATNIKAGETLIDTETSRIDGKTIIKNGENYYSMDSNGSSKNYKMETKLDSSSSKSKLEEMILDILVGDVKNQFVVDGNTISVNIEGAQIPELAKLAVSAAIEEKNNEKSHNSRSEAGKDNFKDAFSNIPTLKNVDVKSLNMTAKVNGNTLAENNFKIVISGEDENSIAHEFEISVNTTVSNVNSTKADSIDTEGKNVKTMEDKFKQHGKNNN